MYPRHRPALTLLRPSRARTCILLILLALFVRTAPSSGESDGAATLAHGPIMLTPASLPSEPHILTSVFAGAPYLTGSVSNAISYTVNPAANTPQTITFPAPATPAYAATSVTLTATSTSGLPVTYMVVSGPASVTGNTLTYTGLGTVTIQATQAGDATYTSAPPVTVTVTSQLLNQTLTTRTAPIPTVILFTATGTLASINVTTQGAPLLDFALAPSPGGNACNIGALYSAGQTCTALFTFAPTHPGPRFGGIALADAQGNLLANSYLLGSGTGPQLFYLPPTQSFLGSGFGYASGAAIDGFGNVFISDKAAGIYEIYAATGQTHFVTPLLTADDVIVDGSGNVFAVSNTTVIEIVAINGTLPTNPVVRTLATGFSQLDGLKVDSNGNVFVADAGASRNESYVSEILAVNGSVPANPTIIKIASGFGGLSGVAVDTSGNVFVADASKRAVFEVFAVNGTIPANPTIVTVGSGFITPANVAFDGVGNLFVPDVGTHSIREILAVNGVIPPNPTIVDLGSGIITPNGLVVDASGNVFIADSNYSQAVELSYGTPPTLAFAATTLNTRSADSPKSFTITNAGNADLAFPAPATGTNPAIDSSFSVDAASACPSLAPGGVAFVLHATQSCTTAVDFNPTTVGPVRGALVRTDNNLDIAASTQSVQLTGVGLALAPTIVFSVPNHTFGDAPFPVSATSNSPASFTYSVLSGPATIAGNVVTLTGTGTITLQATQPATGSYAAGSATAVFEVTAKAQTITFPTPVTPAYDATSVGLLANATSGLPITYTVLSGPATVTGNVLTYTGLGLVTVQAAQAGGAGFSAATPVTNTVTTQLVTEPLGGLTEFVTVILFKATGILSDISVTTQGAPSLDFFYDGRQVSTCERGAMYAAGQTCFAQIRFIPTHPGPRFGGITLTDAQGNLLASSYLLGEGIGPQLFYLPATQSTIGGGFGYLSGAAVDGSGNLYLSDKTSGISQVNLATGASRNLNPLPGAADVIVDGSGNVFAIDVTRVVEIPAVNGVIPPNPTLVVLATGFYNLDGVKVDSNGDIFVADGGDTAKHPGSVTELLAVNGVIPPNPATFNISFASGASVLTGVAVDINGNVFASDQQNHAVFEALAVNGSVPPNPTIISVGSGFLVPTNVAFDGIGDLFVPDAGTHSIREVLALNGSIPASPTIVDLGAGLVTPQGLVVDPSGNVFIADSSIAQATELNYGIPPTLTFTGTPVNTTSPDSPKAFTISNAGNADLVFLPPVSGNNPTISASFTIDATSTCPTLGPNHNAAFALHPTQSCVTAIDFLPTAVGPITGTVVRTDNNLNIAGSTQTVKLVGNGLALAPTIVFNVPNHNFSDPPFPVAATSNSPAPITYSVVSGPATIVGSPNGTATVTLTGAGTVTLQAAQAASGIYTAGSANATFQVAKLSQTITFAQPATPIAFTAAPLTLNATASSGLPVVFSILSGPARVSGTTLTITGGGTIVVAADQPGNANYAPAAEVTRTITVTFGLPIVTLAAAPNPVFLHNPVTLSAAIASSAGTPSGTVSFVDTFGAAAVPTPIGIAPIVNGQAVLATSALAVGTHSITAVYSGDLNFASLTSSPVVVLVEDFSLIITNPTLTIPHGGTGVYNFVVTSVGGAGLASTITLTTTGQPEYSTYVFAPAIIGAGSGTTQGTLTIHTPDFPSGPFYLGRLAGGGTFTLAALFALILPKRRRRRSLLATTLLLVCALASTTLITGCGSGWKTQHWFVTVTATSGNLTRTAQATLTSQP